MSQVDLHDIYSNTIYASRLATGEPSADIGAFEVPAEVTRQT